MDLKIFDVEHGACALLTCDDDTRLLIDCGHNATTGWYPGAYLYRQGIRSLEMLGVTNYDEDHVSGIIDLCDRIDVQWLWRNTSVSGATVRSLKSADGMGAGIERLVREIEHVFTGDGSAPLPSFQGMERKAFYNVYPSFDDENNLSLAMYLKCHGIGVLFPGDLERAGWLELLKQPAFRTVLQNTQVFIASHHGRESGFCEEVFEYCNPYYVVISDKGYMYNSQETIPLYRRVAQGGPFRGETRRVLTTRRDGRIGFTFEAGSWATY